MIKHPARKANSRGMSHIVLSPRQARHLASVLILNAQEAEAEADAADNDLTKAFAATEADNKTK